MHSFSRKVFRNTLSHSCILCLLVARPQNLGTLAALRGVKLHWYRVKFTEVISCSFFVLFRALWTLPLGAPSIGIFSIADVFVSFISKAENTIEYVILDAVFFGFPALRMASFCAGVAAASTETRASGPNRTPNKLFRAVCVCAIFKSANSSRKRKKRIL